MDRTKTLATILLLASTACNSIGWHGESDNVGIYIVGSDIGTQENLVTRALRDALELRLQSAGDLHLATSDTVTLKVRIPEFVEIDRSAVPPLVRYTAIVSRSTGTPSHTIRGNCPLDSVENCADDILRKVRSVRFRSQ